MIGLSLFILIIVLISYSFSILLDEEFALTIPLSFNILILLTYLCGIFINLNVGFIFICSLGIAAFAYVVLKLIKKESRIHIVKKLNSPSLFIWIIFTFALCLWIYGMKVWSGDDLVHWGLVTKNLFTYNKFCVTEDYSIFFVDYPQLSSLPGYLIMKLNGSWNDTLLFVSMGSWSLALLQPLLYKCRFSQFFKILVSLGVMIFLPLGFGYRYTIYNCLQVDRLLGIVLAYCIIISLLEISDRMKWLSLLCGTASLSLIKGTGIYLSILLIVFLFFSNIKSKKIYSVRLGVLLGIDIIFSMSWTVYLKINEAIKWVNITGMYADISVFDLFVGKGDLEQYNTLKAAVSRFIDLKYIALGMNQSYIVWLVILAIGIFLIGLNRGVSIKSRLGAILWMLGGAFAWWLGMMYVMLFHFTVAEMRALSSYDRYMDTYIIGILFAILGLLLVQMWDQKWYIPTLAAMLCAILVCKTMLYNFMYIHTSVAGTLQQANDIGKKCNDKVLGRLIPGKDSIYVISQNSGHESGDYYFAIYYLAPIRTNTQLSINEPGNRSLSYCIGDKYSLDDTYTTEYTVSEFENVLSTYTYLLILNFDDNFTSNYSVLFEGEINKGFYQINHTDMGIRLMSVE
ncbi:MAG: hypothetical protein J1E61_00515 [Lachnospiraceae bacterium]|nr:hypothetical protein [Lachnospiraceae bacterium]